MTGEKKFVDNTLPPGAASVAYRVRAMRSTKKGELSEFNINFSVPPGSPVSFVTPDTAMVQRAA